MCAEVVSPPLPKPKVCKVCSKGGKGFNPFGRRKVCPGGCNKLLCSSCLSYACVTAEDACERPYRIQRFCKDCFQTRSSIDFTATEDLLGPKAGEAHTVVFVHGGGGNRFMFRQHARAMLSKGYRCVLLDLPGHGARSDEHLSLRTAVAAIAHTIRIHAPPFRGRAPILVGGSLGGYIGMEFVGAHPELVSAAVFLMCGQAVGVGRGLSASLGLWAMDMMLPSLGPVTILKGLVNEASKNGHIPESVIMEIALRPGMSFEQGAEQIKVLKQSDPVTSLPRFPGPTLFINGTKDYRDSEQLWLSSAQSGKLILYKGGDHFFSHDTRFVERLNKDMGDFFHEVWTGIPVVGNAI